MKKLIISALLLINVSVFAQFPNGKEFVSFGLISPSQKLIYMRNNDWHYVRVERWKENHKASEEYNFLKSENGIGYILTLLCVTDLTTATDYYATKLSTESEASYNRLIKSMKSVGFVFKEYEKGKFRSTQDEYTVSYWKTNIKGSILYEIEVAYY
jgi:hypothetical protein